MPIERSNTLVCRLSIQLRKIASNQKNCQRILNGIKNKFVYSLSFSLSIKLQMNIKTKKNLYYDTTFWAHRKKKSTTTENAHNTRMVK